LDEIKAGLRELCQGYDAWLLALPENQADGVLAEKLDETVTVLEEVIDQLDGLELPLGFGRD
jgi:hypothetical protein